ncbi:hypothetical protein AUP68_06559 [Ilyonectria robusta]
MANKRQALENPLVGLASSSSDSQLDKVRNDSRRARARAQVSIRSHVRQRVRIHEGAVRHQDNAGPGAERPAAGRQEQAESETGRARICGRIGSISASSPRQPVALSEEARNCWSQYPKTPIGCSSTLIGQSKTDTTQFMAAEALCRSNHTDRSRSSSPCFGYARQSWRTGFAGLGKSPNKSRLRKREIGGFKYIAATKAGDMTVDCLEGIMGELPEALDALQPRCFEDQLETVWGHGEDELGIPAKDLDFNFACLRKPSLNRCAAKVR